jgi:Cof subfamily protein (haloacid dehalogenase superfamily)
MNSGVKCRPVPRVVVSDLDGTLLQPDHSLSPRTRDVLRTLHDRNVRIMLASGRAHPDVQGIRALLGMDIALITSNGAIVHDENNHPIYSATIPLDLVQMLLDMSLPKGVHRNLYQGNDWWVEEANPALLKFHEASGFGYKVTDFADLDRRGIQKIFFIAGHDLLVPLEKEIRRQWGDRLSIAFSLPVCLEVMQFDVNKGNAIERVLHHAGGDIADVIAFGDGMNDYEMLKVVGQGVVMGNAHDMLKKALPAHPRALANGQEGVAVYLENLFGL